jgi:hypothetical protein
MSLSTAKLFIVPTIVWLAGVAIVFLVWALGMSESLAASLLAIGFVCLAASLIGQWPIVAIRNRDRDKVAAAVLVSMAIRSGTALLGMAALFKLGILAPPGASAGCGFWYSLMLFVDVWVVSRHIGVIFFESSQST